MLDIEEQRGETLFKIFELIRAEFPDGNVFYKKFETNKAEYNRFADAVHNPFVSGDKARHAIPDTLNSADPMTLIEAELYIRRIAEQWLNSFRSA